MRTMALMAALSLTAIGAVASGEEPAALNVLDFGAKADGKTDDTASFQKALDACKAKGGAVLAPAGTYLIAGSLDVPQGTTLKGVWEAPHHADIGKGTVLYATGGAGDENAPPLVKLNQSSCIRGITVLYPDQDIDHVKAYPWTIQGSGMHGSVIDVTLVNSYKGIDFGTYGNELHYIRNVFGCPLKIGIFVDKCTDIGRIEDVHFNPHYWVRAAHPSAPTGDKWKRLADYLTENLIGFLIGQTDWEYMSNCFVILPKIGYHFVKTERGAPNAVLTQCGSDVCPIAVQVDACQGHAGIAFSNSQFMATVIVGKDNPGPVKFANCGFWSIDSTDNQAALSGSGTVTFSSCHFDNWARKDPKAACILVNGGSAIVSACEFMAQDKTQIEFGPGTVSAAILGCRFRGGQKIVNHAGPEADIQMGLNIK